MKKTRIILLSLLGIIAAGIVGGCIYLNTLMPIITGYAAKNLASAVFVQGREQADAEALDLNFSFIKYTRNKVDREAGTVTSRFLWAKSTAVYREGYGVTLIRGKAELKPFPLAPMPAMEESLQWEENPEVAAIADAYVDSMSYGGVPFALLVVKDGKVIAEKYKDGFGPKTPFLSWSMAKSFTQALAGIMQGDGLVDIYEPLGLPEWQNDDRRKITLNDLFRMQSGLEWNEDYGNRSDVNLMLHDEPDMAAFTAAKPLEYEPGTHWYYSSGSINIAMKYLKSRFASDEEFWTYTREKLFAPLGISNPVFEADMTGSPVGSSYLYVTARDYARFGLMYLQDGVYNGQRILPEGWVEYTSTPTEDSDGRYCSAFWHNACLKMPDVPADTFDCRGHDGQEVLIIPSENMVVVILGFTHGVDRFAIFNELMKDILSCWPKKISFLGDSYTTFEGYIPSSSFTTSKRNPDIPTWKA